MAHLIEVTRELGGNLESQNTEILEIKSEINLLREALSYFLYSTPGSKGQDGADHLYPFARYLSEKLDKLPLDQESGASREELANQLNLDLKLLFGKQAKMLSSEMAKQTITNQTNFSSLNARIDVLTRQVTLLSKRSESEAEEFSIDDISYQLQELHQLVNRPPNRLESVLSLFTLVVGVITLFSILFLAMQ